jgi:Sulfatase
MHIEEVETTPRVQRRLGSASAGLLLVLLYGPILSAPLWLMAPRFGLVQPGFINLEFLLIGGLALFLPRGAVVAFLVADMLLDVLSDVSKTFFFLPEQLPTALNSLIELPALRLLRIFAALILFASFCALLSRFRPRHLDRRIMAASIIGVGALLYISAYMCGQDVLLRRDVVNGSFRLVRSPTATMLRRLRVFSQRDRELHAQGRDQVASASLALDPLLHVARATVQPNVVLVLLESWGEATEPTLTDRLISPYRDPSILLHYTVRTGSVPFYGTTVSGEARELCQSGMAFGILGIDAQQAAKCLPNRFRTQGYLTVAAHGYLGSMFSRDQWYPRMGFDEMDFGPQFDRMGLPRCNGAFPGTCDAAIASWIGAKLEYTQKPTFLYWVTLNSHLPVIEDPNATADPVCSQLDAAFRSSPLCDWMHLVYTVHASIRDLALRPGLRPTVFVVVGDHAPPFARERLRGRFSPESVPYMILWPRTR